METRKIRQATIAVILTAIGFAGCGGASADKSPSPSVSKDFGGVNGTAQQALSVLSKAMGSSQQPKVAIGGEATGGELVSISGSADCDTSGKVDYSGTVSEDSAGNGTFDLDFSYGPCDGLSGNLGLNGSIFEDDQGVDILIGFDGKLEGDGCSLSFSNLELTAKGQFSEGVAEMANGGISAICGEDRAECSFDHVNMADSDAMEAACTCAGEGCDFSFTVDVTTGNDDEVDSEDSDDSGDDEIDSSDSDDFDDDPADDPESSDDDPSDE